jgi:hypothetical protein
MSSWIVELLSEQGETATVRLLDTFGPLNDWQSDTPGAFSGSSGPFTNQNNRVSARGCGVVPCWVLDNFDIDSVSVGQSGPGECYDDGGSFRVSSLTWTVTQEL